MDTTIFFFYKVMFNFFMELGCKTIDLSTVKQLILWERYFSAH